MPAAITQLTRRDAAEASLIKLLDTTETAAVIGIGRRTLQEKVAAREISVIRIGRAIRFSADDIAAFIEKNRQPAVGWKGGK